jgi:DNA repair exonuclease SbcCD nuclease subunit
LEEIENVFIVDEPTELQFRKSKRNCLLLPWNSKPEDVGMYDLLLGHFEFIGAKMQASVSEIGYTGDELTNIAPLVFSGHYHLQNDYKFKNGSLITIGSPLQLNWGDYNSKKYLYIFDTENFTYTTIENNYSPVYKKVYWSDIIKNKDTLKDIENCFIELNIDTEYEYDKVIKIIQYINSKNKLSTCNVKYLYNPTSNNILTDSDIDDSILKMDRLKQVEEYANKKVSNELDISKLLKYCENYYKSVIDKFGENV